MKERIKHLLDRFEARFSILIELIAFLGGIACFILAITLFVILILNQDADIDGVFGVIMVPGLIGFLGVMILFALRITRHLTKDTNES